MTSSAEFLELLRGAQTELDRGISGIPQGSSPEGTEVAQRCKEALADSARRMWDNYPYASPLYAGQMLKPPHAVARAAYAMAMAVNPNNHALDGGRASSAMELEAVAAIAGMFGLPRHLGHLTSGGTFANLEALWVAGQLAPGKMVVASAQAHYTHSRISGVLGLRFRAVGVDSRNRMSLGALEDLVKTGEVGTVVVTLGTTATGAVDPLDEVLRLRETYGFRVHVDAAYGGYFRMASNLEAGTQAAFAAICRADSIVVDPHKHGLQPYGCGCVLFSDSGVGRLYKHDSPYTYFTSKELHLGEISLECSRAGAAAVALWTTQRVFPMERGGEFAKGLEGCHAAALRLYEVLRQAKDEPGGDGGELFVVPSAAPELDIAVWACAGATVEESSARAQRVFDEAEKLGIYLALAKLPVGLFPAGTWADGDRVTCLRSVLMKWEHLDWLERIFEGVRQAASSF